MRLFSVFIVLLASLWLPLFTTTVGADEIDDFWDGKNPDSLYFANHGCPAGSYRMYGYPNPAFTTRKEVCWICPKGTSNPYGGPFIVQFCVNCEAGYYQDSIGSYECKKADRGYFADGSGPFNVLTGMESGSIAQTPCPAGYYQDSIGSYECKKADRGYFADGSGPFNIVTGMESGSIAQIPCPAGSYNKRKGLGSCTTAEAGTYAGMPNKDTGEGGAATNAWPCRPGSYSTEGQTSCTKAEKGYFAKGPSSKGWRATEQTECPAGTYQPKEGRSACITCPNGTSSEAGASACE